MKMSLLNHLSLLKIDWNYEILGTQYFSENWKLAGITPVYKKKDPTPKGFWHHKPWTFNCQIIRIWMFGKEVK